MERIRELTRFQKGVLLLLLIMAVAFTAVYAVTTARVGYSYRDEILVPRQENGATVYEGEIWGQQTVLSVFGQTVALRYGNQSYGPYTVREDPTAIPGRIVFTTPVTGLEIRKGEEIYFRGAMQDRGSYIYLVRSDGTEISPITITTNGNVSMEPSIREILTLIEGPELTHKGSWGGYFLGLLLCIVAAVSVLFADELFRFSMHFHVENAEDAEPSGWELGRRYITWILLPICAFAVFIKFLQ